MLDHGADLNAQNVEALPEGFQVLLDGKEAGTRPTAVDLAHACGHHDAVELLVRRGACYDNI
eukprot:15926525-Heterocapsa_arctica.AAC.1